MINENIQNFRKYLEETVVVVWRIIQVYGQTCTVMVTTGSYVKEKVELWVMVHKTFKIRKYYKYVVSEPLKSITNMSSKQI